MSPVEDNSDESLWKETSSNHPDFEVFNLSVGMQAKESLLNTKDSVLEDVDIDISSLFFHDVNHLYSFYKF
jgi:hypothetical protein